MFTGSRLIRFRTSLLTWFAEFQRDLPWRRTKDPYHIWLSEVMLQQTRVAAAIPYYEKFLRRFPAVEALAKAPEEEVLRQWAGLGYYSRARNLQKAARQLVAVHNSCFPDTREKALALSGIGAYTAAAILSIAYGKHLAVLDGNVARVVARLGAIRDDLRSPSRWQQLQQSADGLLSPDAPGDWNQAMMELGATICTPRSPQCLLCPVAQFCRARKLGMTDVIPEKRSKRAPVEVKLATLVLLDPHGRTLLLPPPKSIEKRTATHELAGLLSRMWHFPTIQVNGDAAGDLRTFVADTIFRGRKVSSKFVALAKVRHSVTYRQITVIPFLLKLARLPRLSQAKLLQLDNLSTVPISNLTRKVAHAALSSKAKSGKAPAVRATSLPY